MRISPHGRCIVKRKVLGILPLRSVDLFYKLLLMKPTQIGTLELAVLLTVARLQDEAYGLNVRRDLHERTGRDHSVGAIYTTLQRLADKNLLKTKVGPPLPVRGGRTRYHYHLTAAGQRALREAERSAAALWFGVPGTAGGPGR